LHPSGSSAASGCKPARLLAGSAAGIVFNEHTPEDGAVVFHHACKLGLEGTVSKRPQRALPLRAVTGMAEGQEPGHSRTWVNSQGGRAVGENGVCSLDVRCWQCHH
jgi:hypothetical protein